VPRLHGREECDGAFERDARRARVSLSRRSTTHEIPERDSLEGAVADLAVDASAST
jgi:hypothetical protein